MSDEREGPYMNVVCRTGRQTMHADSLCSIGLDGFQTDGGQMKSLSSRDCMIPRDVYRRYVLYRDGHAHSVSSSSSVVQSY